MNWKLRAVIVLIILAGTVFFPAASLGAPEVVLTVFLALAATSAASTGPDGLLFDLVVAAFLIVFSIILLSFYWSRDNLSLALCGILPFVAGAIAGYRKDSPEPNY